MPRKNIRMFAGRPLAAYTVAAARNCAAVDRVIVSTDDAQIADICRAAGAEVPFMRPAHLAEDTVPDWPVFLHALEFLRAQGYEPDYFVHLRPTAPLRRVSLIDEAIRVMSASMPDTLVSVSPVSEPPQKMWRIEHGILVRLLPESLGIAGGPESPRQQLERVYRQNGLVDCVQCATVQARTMFGRTCLPLVVSDPMQLADIDTPEDFALAEQKMHAVLQSGMKDYD